MEPPPLPVYLSQNCLATEKDIPSVTWSHCPHSSYSPTQFLLVLLTHPLLPAIWDVLDLTVGVFSLLQQSFCPTAVVFSNKGSSYLSLDLFFDT